MISGSQLESKRNARNPKDAASLSENAFTLLSTHVIPCEFLIGRLDEEIKRYEGILSKIAVDELREARNVCQQSIAAHRMLSARHDSDVGRHCLDQETLRAEVLAMGGKPGGLW